MKIILEHAPNSDITDGGYWQPCNCPERQELEAGDLATAVLVMRGWIRHNGLGGGNMTHECGTVYDDGKAIARVSYNGRVWTPFEYGDSRHVEIEIAA